MAFKIKPGITRQEVIAILGEPDDWGGTSRKYPTPSVFKYGTVQLYFQPWKDGRLIYAADYADGRRVELCL